MGKDNLITVTIDGIDCKVKEVGLFISTVNKPS